MKRKASNDKKKKNKNNNKNNIILLNKNIPSSSSSKNIKINNNIFIINTFKPKNINNNFYKTYKTSNSNKNIKSKNININSSPPHKILENQNLKTDINGNILPLPLKQNLSQKYLEINDLIGETKIPINIIFNKLDKNNNTGKISNKSYGKIKAYAASTNKGIIRNYNEDRVSIIINMNQPDNYINKGKFPRISYFGIFDGHGGSKCSEYLRDHLLELICSNQNFPSNVDLSIKEAFKKADEDFLNNYSVKNDKIIDFSGSCALFLLIINNIAFIANVGDSRCLISYNNGKIKKAVTRDHKPNYSYEKERIVNNGGIIYQSQNLLNVEDGNVILKGKILIGPYRVLPGRLSVSRTIGDPEAKITKYGGIPNVVINEPDIYSFNIDKDDIDYFILGCDGIFDQLNNDDIFECVSLVINHNKKLLNEKNKNNENRYIDLHTTCGDIVNLILNASMQRKSFDNVTCLFISFKDLLNLNTDNSNTIICKKINKNTLTVSKSLKNAINNINLKNKLKEDIPPKKNLKRNYSEKGKNIVSFRKNSEKNKNTIDYPNKVKKRIILYSKNFSNSNIFNKSFNNSFNNNIKLKNSPAKNLKFNGYNNNKKIEIYINNSKKLKKNNKIKNLNNSNSLKYYSFTEKFQNNSFKNEKKKLNLIDIDNNSSAKKSKNRKLNSHSHSKKKLIKTEGNEMEKNKDKNFYVNIIFKKDKNLRNSVNKKNLSKDKSHKKVSKKKIFKNYSRKNNLFKDMNDSSEENKKNYLTSPSCNSNKKSNKISNIKIASINLDLKKTINKINKHSKTIDNNFHQKK